MRKLFHLNRFLFLAITVSLTLLFFFGLKIVVAQSTQALNEDWRNSDYGFISHMIDTDLTGNIYVVGDTSASDYLVIKKFNPAGDLLWNITYNPAERLRGVWITVDSSNHPIVLASSIAGSNGDPTGWVTLKYDTDGNLQWVDNQPGSFADARRVEVDINDDIYVSGRMFQTNQFGNTTLDSVLIKYDSNGVMAWKSVFDNASAVDEPYSMSISPDSSLIGLAGKSGNLFMALVYDPDGNLLWSDTNPNIYPSNDVTFGPGNTSYFATGTYSPMDPNPYQMAIAKFDSAGNQLWLKSYAEGDRTFRLRLDDQGNILATGIDQNGYLDWMTIKTDNDGNLLWSQRYDGGKNNDEIPNILLVDATGAVYVTGTGGPNPGSGNISYLKGVVAKYNSDGSPQWAVFDEYAGGKALSLGANETLASIGFGYLVTTHYTQTGLPDTIPAAPSYLSGVVSYDGISYRVNLNFVENANNEFWVDLERCTGSGCTDFSKIGQTRGENTNGFWDENVSSGVTYNYRVKAIGFMGASIPSNIIEVTIGSGTPPLAPSNLTAEMDINNVLLNWQDNSSDENQFYIERCQGVGCNNFSNVGVSGIDITTWTDSDTMEGESYSYRIKAWNSNGFSDYSNTATILVPASPNNTPVLDYIGDRTVEELSTLVFTVTATDPDLPVQILTFTLDAGAPSGATIDPVSGVFSWTPTEAQGPGIYPISVIVTDNGDPALSDSETINITVNENLYIILIPFLQK
jgi:hypothetical protein